MASARPLTKGWVYSHHVQLDATQVLQNWEDEFADNSIGKYETKKLTKVTEKPLTLPSIGQFDGSGVSLYVDSSPWLLFEEDGDAMRGETPTEAQRAARARRFAQEAAPTPGVSSPSRGDHVAGGPDITKREVQDQFRIQLAEMHKAYEQKYGANGEIAALYDGPQRDELQNILLEFRKLREGIIAARRNDDFAIDAYETSVELAIQCCNISQLASALPPLVYELHAARALRQLDRHHQLVEAGRKKLKPKEDAKDKSGIADATQALEKLSIADAEEQLEQRALFASYLLLVQLASSGPSKEGFDGMRSKFWSAFGALTMRRQGIYDRPFPALPADHPHLKLARNVFRAVDTNNWTAYRRILEDGTEEGFYSTGQIILVRACMEGIQQRTWEAYKAAFPSISTAFVAKSLLYGGWWTAGDEDKGGLDEIEVFFAAQSPPWIVDPSKPETVKAGLFTPGATRIGAKDALKELGRYHAAPRVKYFGAWPIVPAVAA